MSEGDTISLKLDAEVLACRGTATRGVMPGIWQEVAVSTGNAELLDSREICSNVRDAEVLDSREIFSSIRDTETLDSSGLVLLAMLSNDMGVVC